MKTKQKHNKKSCDASARRLRSKMMRVLIRFCFQQNKKNSCARSTSEKQYDVCVDPLLSLSTICLSMQMDGCESWKAM